jgi:signal peptidase II
VTAEPAAAPDARSLKARFLLLALAVFALDQWTKWLVERHLPFPTSREIVPGFFHLSHVKNSGVAFGLLAGAGENGGAWILALLGVAAIAVVAVYFRGARTSDKLLLTALALVLGGATGNLLDRVTTGAVTDFLGVYLGSYRWPDFNVADSAISVGLCLLILDSFRPRRAPAAAPAEAP